jgi:hypothetical protein
MAYLNLIIIGLFVLSLGLSYGNQHWGSPLCAIFIRWNRWILFSLVVGMIALQFEFTQRPYWLVTLCAFLVWFLVETTYNWIAIGVLSKSSIPLFPTFEGSNETEKWPASRHSLALKESIRSEGFERTSVLSARLGEGVFIHSSIYEDASKKIRLQLLFVPVKQTVISVCCILSSINDKGERIITDNIFLPFGGFYPENWHLVRKPYMRKFSSLLGLHKKRIQSTTASAISWDQEPIDDLREQYRLLQKINAERGFLLPLSARDAHGRITSEGRYRIWKEIWMLSYLGLPVRY